MIRSVALLAVLTTVVAQESAAGDTMGESDCEHWMCFCEEERYAVCEEPEDKPKVFQCLQREVVNRNEGFSAPCTEAIAARAGINLNSYPPECGKTGWKCTCEPELTAACSDVDQEDSGAMWGCLTTYATTANGGIQSKECQDSIETRLELIRKSQMASLVQIPPGVLTSLLSSTCRSSKMRIRSGAGKAKAAKCLVANDKQFVKCDDASPEQIHHIELFNATNPDEGHLVMQVRDNLPFCLSPNMEFLDCFQNRTGFNLERLPNQGYSIKHEGKCLTAQGKGLKFMKCSGPKAKKAAKKQQWFVEPVFAATASSYDNAGFVLSRTLSQAMSQILTAEVAKMEKQMYSQMVQQMEYMLGEAGLDLFDAADPMAPNGDPMAPAPTAPFGVAPGGVQLGGVMPVAPMAPPPPSE